MLISQHATLEAEREASLKQAESASEMAKKMMEEKDNKVSVYYCLHHLIHINLMNICKMVTLLSLELTVSVQ